MTSVTGELPRLSAPDAVADGEPDACAHCAATLQPGQEWCLECGSARTVVHPPPDWRIALGIVATVVLLVLAGFAIALIGLSSDANRELRATTAPSASPPRPPAAAAAAPAGATTRRPASAISAWPVGLSGWTVVLARRPREAPARTVARRVISFRVRAGVIDARQHPALKARDWLVFSGRYPSGQDAAAAAARLRARGFTLAQAVQVAPPGGL